MGYEESATLQYASDLSKEANMFGASGLSLADIALMYSHR